MQKEKMCQLHPTYRHRRCTECWKLYGHMDGFSYVFRSVCPHGRRKERCTLCGKTEKRPLCPWHGKRPDRCKQCKDQKQMFERMAAQIEADNAAARKKVLDTIS